jgi:hypothetical protein
MICNKIANRKPQNNKPAEYNNGIKPAEIKPFTFEVTIEHDTLREQCAIDALMTLVRQDRDMYTYSGDTHAYAEYMRFVEVNKKKIYKEEMTDRYTL